MGQADASEDKERALPSLRQTRQEIVPRSAVRFLEVPVSSRISGTKHPGSEGPGKLQEVIPTPFSHFWCMLNDSPLNDVAETRQDDVHTSYCWQRSVSAARKEQKQQRATDSEVLNST